MSKCPDPRLFNEYVRELNMVNVEENTEKNFRYNVFAVDPEDINVAVRNGNADLLPGIEKAKPVLNKVDNALGRAALSYKNLDSGHKSIVNKFRDDFVGKKNDANEDAALMSIAMLELIDATKGDVDKARKYGLDTKGTLIGNTIPAVPLSRLAASIGRKSMFTYGLRFQSTKGDKKTAAEIESLYYMEGLVGLELLQKAGYLDFSTGVTTIQDYKISGTVDEDYAPAKLVTGVRSVFLNTKALGIKNTTADGVEAAETAHFNDRSGADLSRTALGVIVETLGAIRNVTQPSNDIAPDTVKKPKSLPLKRNDPYGNVQNESTESGRQKLYDSPLYVSKEVHKFASALSRITDGVKEPSASGYLKRLYAKAPLLLKSVFGIQTSNEQSVDNNERTTGQNRSVTTPLDDFVDSYTTLTDSDGNPIGLHLELKGGRNQRLYYNNTILNPHASKASRHTLTSGEQNVEMKTEDFNMLVYAMKENLDDSSITFDHITKGGNADLEEALDYYNDYLNSSSDESTVMFVTNMAESFPGVDYAQLLTTLGGVNDVRKAIAAGDTHVTTEFMVSTDATAQGGNLTLQQSLGTSQTEMLTEYFTRIGMFSDVDNKIENGDLAPLDDIYGLMTEGTRKYLGKNGGIASIAIDPVKGQPKVNVKALVQSTLDLLFGNDPKGERNLAKNSTLPFIYNQGKSGAITSMSESVAKQIMGTLETAETRQYLSQILGDPSYSVTTTKPGTDSDPVYKKTNKELFAERGLYIKVRDAIKKSGVPEQLFFILESEVNAKYLSEYKKDAAAVYALAEKVENSHKMKVLTLGAVLDGETDIKKFGMTLTKIIEVSSEVDVGDGEMHTVLTRRQELNKAIMDVSVTHGMDSGLLYKAIDMVMGDGWEGGGGVVVHDQLIGSVDLVRKVEAQYVILNAKLVSDYDVHSQVMDSIALYDPKVANSEAFKKLNTRLKKRLAAKKAIVESQILDLKTDALIGDKGKIAEFAKGQETNDPTVVQSKANKLKEESAPSQTSTRAKESLAKLNAGPVTDTKPDTAKVKDQTALLESFADESPLIARFLKMSDKPAISGRDNAFIPADDQLVISGTDQGRGELTPKKLGADDRKLQKELIEHEIVHHNTVGYIGKVAAGNDKSAQNDLTYFNKTINVLRRTVGSNKSNFSAEALDRVNYIIHSGTDAVSIAEFISIMGSEPDTANEIYKAVAGQTPTKTLKARIADFVKKVAASLMSLSDKDLKEAVNADKLQAALVRTMENGRSFKEEQRAEAIKYQKGFMALYAGSSSKVEKEATMRYLNQAVASMLNSRVESNGKVVAIKINDFGKKFPLYKKAVEALSGFYDDTGSLQQLVNAITGEGTDKVKKGDLLSESAKVDSDQKSSIGYQQGEFKKALAGVSAETRQTVGRFVKQMPLHDYFIRLSAFDTAAKINAEVTRLEAEINDVNDSGVTDVNDLIDRNVKRTAATKEGTLLGGNIYSLYQYGDDKHGLNVKNLLALKSIQAIGTKEFEELLANTTLVNLIKDNVVANKLTLIKVGGTESMKDSLVPDYYKETNITLPVTMKSVNSYINGENNGWTLLRNPTKTELGIVYRQLIDSTDIKGAQTDLKLKTDDVDITEEYQKKYTNVVQSGMDSFKLVLSPKEKQTLGVEEDFVDSLVRGTAHSMAVSDSQHIRDAIVEEENRFDGTDDEKIASLEEHIKASNIDAPWFVKLDKDKLYPDLPKSVRAKYKSVGKRASDVVGKSGRKFSDEVHLVRKDMAHILIGDHAASPINYKPAKWAIRVLKDVTAMNKIRMVVTNPAKIASDNLSNMSYLSVSGASPLFIAENYKEISRDYNDYQNLLHKTIQIKVKLAADPENEAIKAKLESIQKQIDANPVGDLEQKGFINSLGSDLVARSSDVSSGLQADMETALTYLLKNDKGNKNILGHFITQVHKLGFQSEDYIKYLGGIVGQAKDGQAIEQQIDLSVQRIKDIKSEDDIVAYVSQYTTSPGSELVRLGSSATDLTDVLAKETLYRHAMQNEGMSAEAARIHVLDSFPDYKENLPLAVKQLSDLGIIMFPTFWLRIQKSIYRLAKNKPVGLAAELMIEEHVTGNLNTIVDSNPYGMITSFNGIFHMPLASGSYTSFVPTNALNL